MKIGILDDYQDAVRHLACFNLLKEHEVKVFHHSATGLGQLAIRLADFDALVLIRERTRFTRALLQRLPKLKVISQTGKVSGHIDLDAAKEFGIQILEGSGDPTAPAELTWALIMAASRKLTGYSQLLQQGVWQTASTRAEYNGLGRVLKGRTLGIWGYGKIGKLVASYGKVFGMQVLIWGRPASLQQAQFDGYQVAQDKANFFQRSDVLSLHLRLNDATQGIVSAADLALMKSDALIVNTSRAELIEAGALLAALEAGHPGYAAIDVFEQEPVLANDPLLHRPNVLATPHLGYVEQDSYELYFRLAFENLVRYAEQQAS